MRCGGALLALACCAEAAAAAAAAAARSRSISSPRATSRRPQASSWVLDAKPRAIASIPDLIPAIGLVLPEERLQLFTAAHGGVDLRQVKDLCIAQYKDSQLQIADVMFDPEKVASAFETRAKDPDHDADAPRVESARAQARGGGRRRARSG